MKASTAMVIAKGYTKDTADEFGAVKGAPCQVVGESKDASGNTVIELQWVNSAGATQTGSVTISKGADGTDGVDGKDGKDGVKGEQGASIKSAEFNADEKLVITLDDGTKLAPLDMPTAKVEVSKAEGNIVTQKADGIYAKATDITVDSAISSTSTNPVQNKVVKAELDKKVDKVTGKSLVSDTDIAQITANKNAIATLNGTGAGSVSKQIADEISKLTYLSKVIATKTEIDSYVADPTKAKFNVIYLLKDASAKGSDKYFEYQRIGDETTSTFEQTGDTSTDLTDYAKSEDVVAIQQKTEDKGKALIVGEDGKVVPTEISIDTSMVEKAIVNNWNGNGCNLIPFPYYDGTNKSKDGITYTAFESGEVLAVGIGTSNLAYYITQAYNFTAGTYRLSGCPKGGSDTTYYQYVQNADSAFSMIAKDIGEGATFTLNTDTRLRVGLYVVANYDANITFKPMITKVAEDGSYPTEYQRYASGNVELTDEIARKELELAELKMLGWNVPSECPIQNEINGNQFTQRVGRVDLGVLNWGINAYATPTAFSLHENIDLPDLVSISDNKEETVRCYSPNYTCDSAGKVTGTNRTYTFCVITGKRLYVRADVTTAEELKAELKGKYIYYELETPITTQIDGNEILEKDAVVARVENWVAPNSDEEILALPNGIYSINMGSASQTLFPANWGTLVVLKSKYLYGSMTFISSNAKYYYRNINNGAWRESAWQELATMDKFDERGKAKSGANGRAHVSFKNAHSSEPTIIICQPVSSAYPADRLLTVANPSATGFDVYISNVEQAMANEDFYWMAMWD